MNLKVMNMNDQLIFALDIGTRTVVGLICKQTDDKLEVLAHHVEVHKDRAMKDGQIHDVGQVAHVVNKVKENLEKKVNTQLKSASIAAAGRTLRTIKGSAYQDLSETNMLTPNLIQNVELSALAKCKEETLKLYPDEALYCVGFSVLSKKLNGYNIDTLEGQKGGFVEIEIIATFLPNIVVDSLFEVLKRVNLQIESLTLEPIAAIEVAIPPRFRMLNLALVDIGAGTSDIAISKSGTIIGYGMVQKAGDKITEALAEHYLIDFETAEEVKIAFSSSDNVEFTDILGIKRQITLDEFNNAIIGAVEETVDAIASEIMSLNGKTPGAIFCVGGGSQVELIRIKLAEKLDMPLERVAVRERDTLENIKFNSKQLKGPEVVTPLGIAVTTRKKSYHHFVKVYVNEKEVTIFNAKKTTVAQGLFSAGVKVEEILKGTVSKDFIYRIQGDEIVIKGSKGYPGEIFLNNKKASLEESIKEGDKITVKFPTQPKSITLNIKEVIKHYKRQLMINGRSVELLKKIYVNNIEVTEGYILENGDDIQLEYITYLQELLLGENLNDYQILIDGKPEEGNPIILGASVIEYTPKGEGINLHNVIQTPKRKIMDNTIYVKANEQVVVIEKEKPVLVDVFDKISFDITKPKGTLIIKKNGLDSGFSDPVKDGDEIKIYWSEVGYDG